MGRGHEFPPLPDDLQHLKLEHGEIRPMNLLANEWRVFEHDDLCEILPHRNRIPRLAHIPVWQ